MYISFETFKLLIANAWVSFGEIIPNIGNLEFKRVITKIGRRDLRNKKTSVGNSCIMTMYICSICV